MPLAQTVEKPNPDTIWAILQEVAERQRETARRQEETDRIVRETAESQKENAQQMKENKDDFNKRLGSLTNLFGDFTLGMVAPKLREKFKEFGLVFPKANPNSVIDDTINNICLEVDIMLENGDKAMLVEVKTKLTTDRINKHIERLEKMRKYADLHGDKRTFLGAVAGFAVTNEVREHALKVGFYLIEPDGENFIITPPNDKPKEW